MVIFKRLVWTMAISTTALAMIGLIFHHFIYPSIPVAPNEPYGLGDIITAIIYSFLLFFALISVFLSILLFFIHNKKQGVSVLVLSLISPLIFRLFT